MELELLKRAAWQSFLLMIIVVFVSITRSYYVLDRFIGTWINKVEAFASDEILTDLNGNEGYQQVTKLLSPTRANNLLKDRFNNTAYNIDNTKTEILHSIKESIDKKVLPLLGNRFMIINKPDASIRSISLEDLYMSKSVKITMSGFDKNELSGENLIRINGYDIYHGQPLYNEILFNNGKENGNNDSIDKEYNMDYARDISVVNYLMNDTKEFKTEILIQLDHIYAYELYEDENNYYISMKNPREVYDKIIVIDPGHGGTDAGALSKDQLFYEKDINLSISLYLKELLDRENIKVYYTRLKDDKLFLRQRVMLANELDSDFFISIHCNASKSTTPNGTEILYYDTNFHGVSAMKLASIFSDEIENAIPLKSRGLVKLKQDDIFIMDLAKVPTILIEVGYMTNHSDMSYLRGETNRKAVAGGILNGILRAYDELK